MPRSLRRACRSPSSRPAGSGSTRTDRLARTAMRRARTTRTRRGRLVSFGPRAASQGLLKLSLSNLYPSAKRAEQPLELVELRVQIDPAHLLGGKKLCGLSLSRSQLVLDRRLQHQPALQVLLFQFIAASLQGIGCRGKQLLEIFEG